MYCTGYKLFCSGEQGAAVRPPAGAGYSYGAVLLASCVGALFPEGAARVLGPVLLVGLLGLGIAHGACDQLVLPTGRGGVAGGRICCGLGPDTWAWRLLLAWGGGGGRGPR